MENFKIGNWLIPNKGIIRNIKNTTDYFISKETLSKSGSEIEICLFNCEAGKSQ